jgi:hypothetical protein
VTRMDTVTRMAGLRLTRMAGLRLTRMAGLRFGWKELWVHAYEGCRGRGSMHAPLIYRAACMLLLHQTGGLYRP